MTREILIVSNYYPPEKGAAANRIEQLALKLKQHGYRVSVVCPLPNYPEGKIFKGYKGRFSVTETIDEVTVKRLWISPSVSKNIFKRILSVLSFSTGLAFYLLFSKTPKKVIVQSPPLLLSFLSVAILSAKKKKVILNVSDLWPLAAVELSALKPGSIAHKLSLFMERFIYRNATVVLGQSIEILSHVKTVAAGKPMFLYRNFPDHASVPEFVQSSGEIRIFYAGLLGVAQGVLDLCKKMRTEGLGIEFHIFGNGHEKTAIQKYIAAHPEKKITFHGMIPRAELSAALTTFDIALVPLKTRIYGSVPSKIFEYGALGFPILYFGGGEGNDIVREHNLGWVAEVGDFDALNATLREISTLGKASVSAMKPGVLSTANRHFDLEKQIVDLLEKGVF